MNTSFYELRLGSTPWSLSNIEGWSLSIAEVLTQRRIYDCIMVLWFDGMIDGAWWMVHGGQWAVRNERLLRALYEHFVL